MQGSTRIWLWWKQVKLHRERARSESVPFLEHGWGSGGKNREKFLKSGRLLWICSNSFGLKKRNNVMFKKWGHNHQILSGVAPKHPPCRSCGWERGAKYRAMCESKYLSSSGRAYTSYTCVHVHDPPIGVPKPTSDSANFSTVCCTRQDREAV